jgi:predicted acylesterase/phospholipase RssA
LPHFSAVLHLLLALWRFILPLIALMVAWGFLTDAVLKALGLQHPVLENAWSTMGFGLLLLTLFFIGLVISWNLAALVWRLTRGTPAATPQAPVTARERPVSGALDQYRRIGIVLAGGGAKGAYQAGAMRAIWEYLEEHGALQRVCAVAATSIGAWNAMFWLAGLVRPERPGEPSAQEAWWRAISPERIVDFDWYVPGRHNHLALATPWRQVFRKLFIEQPAVRARLLSLLSARRDDARVHHAVPLHFYLTRSNVGHAVLEFTTNSWEVADKQRFDPRTGAPVPMLKASLYDVLDASAPDQALNELEDAVFASMDIPPVFPYVSMLDESGENTEWFEDGGVIENLPMIFGTAIEQCDLLFVLPLNGSFSATVNRRSLLARLSRVMESRQGVIERNAFKLAYLYNDLHRLEGKSQVRIFAICPGAPLDVGTMDFHKPRAAAAAYRLMHEQTARVLREDIPALERNWIRLVTVSRDERNQPVIDYVEEF